MREFRRDRPSLLDVFRGAVSEQKVCYAFMLAGIGGVNTLAARIYSNSVLRVGSRVRLAEAWRGRT